MLLQFSCSNFRSIKNKIIFSMLSQNSDNENNKKISWGRKKIARISAIYGANGSGKSNFINSVQYMKNIVANSMRYQPGENIMQFSHKLSDKNLPCSFECQFVTKDIRYVYGFSLQKGIIEEEYLYYFPHGRQKKIFERKKLDINSGSSYTGKFQLAIDVLKDNRLFLACLSNYTNINEAIDPFLFFCHDLVIYRTGIDEPTINNWLEYSLDLLEKNEETKNEFLKLLKYFNTGIVDVKSENREIKIDILPTQVAELVKGSFLDSNKLDSIPFRKIEAIYKNFSTDLYSEESSGIKKLFQILCPIIDIMNKGKVLFFDEIETGLHESIVYGLLKIFEIMGAKSGAQLVFTTHDTNLLSSDLLDRDQVWFTELNSERSTDLYSLLEIKDVRKNENLSRGYLKGKYGAIPVLNLNNIYSE